MFRITDIDCELITINENNEICCPKEIFNIIGENWVWDVSFDGNFGIEPTIFKRDDELIIRTSIEDRKKLQWRTNHQVIWTTEFIDETITGESPSTTIHIHSY